MTQAEVNVVLARSEAGDGVIAALKAMGLPWFECLIYLRDRHHDEVKAAKKRQRDARR